MRPAGLPKGETALHSARPNSTFALLCLVIAGLAASLWSTAGSHAQPLRPMVAGYYVHDDPLSWETLAAYGRRLSWVITTNFYISDSSGALRGGHDARVMALARERGLAVHFRVSNLVNGEFDSALAHALVTNRAARARSVADIAATAQAYRYDGVNIDLERVPPADRRALTVFVHELRALLRPLGKTLTVAVPGKTGEDPADPSSGAFDLKALGLAADYLIIMAYDEHWDSGAPGPVASLPWVQAVVRHSVSLVRPRKILLGVAFYGYDWPRGGRGEGISMREAVRRSSHTGTTILWDERAQVPFYHVGDRTVYFENEQSLAHKLLVQTRADLAGIAAWRLGHELPGVWDTISRAADSSRETARPTPPPGQRD